MGPLLISELIFVQNIGRRYEWIVILMKITVTLKLQTKITTSRIRRRAWFKPDLRRRSIRTPMRAECLQTPDAGLTLQETADLNDEVNDEENHRKTSGKTDWNSAELVITWNRLPGLWGASQTPEGQCCYCLRDCGCSLADASKFHCLMCGND